MGVTKEGRADVEVSPLMVEEAAEYASLHRRVFPYYNSTRMGLGFCTGLYGQYAVRAEAVGFGAWQGGKLLGLVIGCQNSVAQDIRRSLLKRSVLATIVRPHLLFRGALLKRVLHYLGRSGGGGDSAPGHSGGLAPGGAGCIKLENIGVASEARGLGIGGLLMDAFCRECLSRGFQTVELFVDTVNHSARRLYEKQGWVIDQNAPAPETSVRYCLELTAA